MSGGTAMSAPKPPPFQDRLLLSRRLRAVRSIALLIRSLRCALGGSQCLERLIFLPTEVADGGFRVYKNLIAGWMSRQEHAKGRIRRTGALVHEPFDGHSHARVPD